MAFVGFSLTFFPQYLIGLRGMPRRVPVYLVSDHVTFLNQLSTVGAFLTGASFVVWLINMWISWKKPVAAGDNPWDGHTLEWATSSPPPHHNFVSLPPIRSARPLWDANHPEHADYKSHGLEVRDHEVKK